MSIDVNAIHNLSTACASRSRDDRNRGKHVNQAGWVTKEQMRKEAAQMTGAMVFYIVFFKALFKAVMFLFSIPLRLFGRKVGITIHIVVLSFVVLFIMIGTAASSRKKDDGASRVEEKKIERMPKIETVVEDKQAQVQEPVAVLPSSSRSGDVAPDVVDDSEKIASYINDAVGLSFAKSAEMIQRVRECGHEEFVPSIQYDLRKLQKNLSEDSRLRRLLLSLPYDKAKAKIDAEIESVFSRILPLVEKAVEQSSVQLY